MNFCVFDLDHTLIKTNISFRYFFHLYLLKTFSKHLLFFSFLYYLLYKTKQISLKDLHKKIFEKFMKERSLEEFSLPVTGFLEKHLEALMNKELVSRLKNHQKRGDYVVLFSSTPSFLTSSIAKKLNIDKSKGTEYQVDHRGKLSKILTLVDGEKKAEFALKIAKKMNISKEKIMVFTDSIEDLPLIKLAGHVVLMNPNRKLRLQIKTMANHTPIKYEHLRSSR